MGAAQEVLVSIFCFRLLTRSSRPVAQESVWQGQMFLARLVAGEVVLCVREARSEEEDVVVVAGIDSDLEGSLDPEVQSSREVDHKVGSRDLARRRQVVDHNLGRIVLEEVVGRTRRNLAEDSFVADMGIRHGFEVAQRVVLGVALGVALVLAAVSVVDAQVVQALVGMSSAQSC